MKLHLLSTFSRDRFNLRAPKLTDTEKPIVIVVNLLSEIASVFSSHQSSPSPSAKSSKNATHTDTDNDGLDVVQKAQNIPDRCAAVTG